MKPNILLSVSYAEGSAAKLMQCWQNSFKNALRYEMDYCEGWAATGDFRLPIDHGWNMMPGSETVVDATWGLKPEWLVGAHYEVSYRLTAAECQKIAEQPWMNGLLTPPFVLNGLNLPRREFYDRHNDALARLMNVIGIGTT